MYYACHVLSRRGAAAAAVGIETTSGPSSQLGGETLYRSFGKMGTPLYRQTGRNLCGVAYAVNPRQAAQV